jgi:hypothetical protein
MLQFDRKIKQAMLNIELHIYGNNSVMEGATCLVITTSKIKLMIYMNIFHKMYKLAYFFFVETQIDCVKLVENKIMGK